MSKKSDKSGNPVKGIERLLLVEDSNVFSTVVTAVFSEQNTDITVAVNLKDALAALKLVALEENPFDAILLDLTLPDSIGMETLDKVREVTESTPLVVLTGTNDDKLGMKMLRHGADDYLVKDETMPRVLIRQVNYAIQRRRMQEELKEAKEIAEESNKLKDKFVGLVAHDFRGPLTGIIGFVEYMKSEDVPRDQQVDLLDRVEKSCWNLSSIVGEVLNLSRLQSGALRPECTFVDAFVLANQAITQLGPLAEKKNIAIKNEIPTDFRIYCDTGLMKQVLQNILSNAIKFSPDDKSIEITADPKKPGVFSIVDHGVGINPKHIDKLFRLEERSTTRGTAGEKGTGYGMPLSYDIVKAHDGELSVSSKQDEGTTFTTTLPHINPLVFIVDDQRVSRTLMKGFLSKVGTDIAEADSGETALEYLMNPDNLVPHLIITDVVMTGIDGIELLRRIKANPRLEDIPVIVATGDEKAETRMSALQLGAADFVVKPLKPEDFIPRVRRIIG